MYDYLFKYLVKVTFIIYKICNQESMVQANPELLTTAVSENNKPTVMVLGSIGHGKSTFLNRLAGDDNFFHAARSVKGVTQYPTKHELPNFILIDTPGLNDCRIPTADWV